MQVYEKVLWARFLWNPIYAKNDKTNSNKPNWLCKLLHRSEKADIFASEVSDEDDKINT